ncbi:leucine-rich repeat extensin-like protein 5 [Arachis duranensis]|uniref:Leucine-rich repeat extensin-like protein 5 n=1 Tax=Arachis duranensis TaxID=130453 RepID=A0A6P4C3D1_ARADU|nr:leucine-rich repeat extensin-like protein 5 [Arachis duranensis]
MEAQPPTPPHTAQPPPLSSVAPPPQQPQQPVPPPSSHLNYPDSVDSSPRSRNTDSWDEPFPPASSKLRLMCSYGGHIVPRPHDKSLCYVGGDTRIVVVERTTSLADLSTRLSKTFLNGRPFSLKYQLPNEDLDSLISVTTDEDLDNMIDEYDRTNNNPSVKPSRIRLFLFPTKPESVQSIPPILESSAKSDDWFLNALNGSGLLNRGFSDSASVNCLLGLDDDASGNNVDHSSRDPVEASSQPGSFGNGKNPKQEVHSVPDSPMLETTSSFGSTSSSPSLANLPPIRVHVEDGSGGGGVRMVQDHKVLGIEEQFAQMGVSVAGGLGQKQDEGLVVLSSPPPPPVPVTLSAAGVGVPVSSALVSGEYQNRVFSDDERSDHSVPVGYRKPPTPQPQLQQQPQLQPQPQSQPQQTQSQSQPQHQQVLQPQFQPKSTGVVDLPSPDSVSSDSSLSNAISRQKAVIYQDQVQIQPGTTRVPSNPVDPKLNVSDPHGRIQMQQLVQDPGYLLQQQFEQQPPPQQPQQQQQQQFIHGTHFIHHAPPGAVPISAYYPVYPSQQQSHPQVYYVPARQPPAYNMPVQQPNMAESASNIPSSRPQTPPNPTTLVPPSAAYNPMRNAPMPKTEMTAAAYRAVSAGTPQLVQVPTSQHQQQYVAYSQIHHPSQSIAQNSAPPPNYAFDYADPAHAQIYYSQPLAPSMPSQYQTMTAAAMVMPDGSTQQPSDNMKQQIRTSQPL